MWNRDDQAFELAMEMGLTSAFAASQSDEECVKYVQQRREALWPVIMKQSEETNEDAADIFHRLMKGVHARHEAQEA